MGFDRIKNVVSLCKNNYDKKTFEHCLRVANYATDSPIILSHGFEIYEYQREFIFIIAMCHDLLEDTNVSFQEIRMACKYSEKDNFDNTLIALTRQKDESYIKYINRLKESNNIFAYIVKLADIKDHLSLTETLTEKLKEKYLEALRYLL